MAPPASVEPSPPALPSAVSAVASSIEASFKVAADKQGIKKALKISIIAKESLAILWTSQLENTPAMLAKVSVSKARSFKDGKKMVSPGACTTMMCYFCPWACGCTNQMPIQGVVGMELEKDSYILVVSGAPVGATDLLIAEDVMAATGFTEGETAGVYTKGGAPDNARIER